MFDFKNYKREILIFLAVFIICAVLNYVSSVYYWTNLFTTYDFDFISIFMYPELVLGSVASMAFGPFAAFGFSLSHIPSFIISILNGNGQLNLFSVSYELVYIFFSFLVSYLSYKLWYGFLRRDNSKDILKLKDIYNLRKFILISILISIVSTLVLYLDLINYCVMFNDFSIFYSYNVEFYILIYILFNFVSIVLFGFILILFINYFDYSNYFPGCKKPLIPFKLKKDFYFNKIFIMGIVCVVLIELIELLGLTNAFTFSNVLQFIILLLICLFYLFKPLKNVKIPSKRVLTHKNMSLFETLIIMFLIFTVILVFIIYFLASYNILYNWGLPNNFSALLYSLFSIAILLIVILEVLSYFERNFTIPLEKISNSLNHYVNNDFSKIDKSNSNKYEEYLNNNSEIGILASSLIKMFEDIENYLDNINSLNKEKQKIESELKVAQKIQDSFLPKVSDFNNDSINLDAVMIPAKSVGGDFYDFFNIDEKHFAFVIGDVSDKGVPAALFMAKSKQLIGSLISNFYNNESLSTIISKVNEELCKNNDSSMFVTSWIGILDIETGKLVYVNAGHDYPLIMKNNEYFELKSESNLVLGVMEEEYMEHEIIISSGDRILLFTDGVTDSISPENEFYGVDRLLNSLKDSNNLSVEDTLASVKKSVNKFTQNQDRFDDFTMLLVEFDS